jgi:hypothetical protein
MLAELCFRTRSCLGRAAASAFTTRAHNDAASVRQLEADHVVSRGARIGDLSGKILEIHALAVAEAAAAIEQVGKVGDRTACGDALGPLASELRRVLTEIAVEP